MPEREAARAATFVEAKGFDALEQDVNGGVLFSTCPVARTWTASTPTTEQFVLDGS